MSESESDAFDNFCDALQEKYNMDHEDREKLVDLYKNQEGLMSKRAALCASAKTTLVVLQQLQSKLGAAIQELRDELAEATPEDETKPEWVKAWKAVDAVGDVVTAYIRSAMMSILADMEGPGSGA